MADKYSLEAAQEHPVISNYIRDGMTIYDVDPLCVRAIWEIRHCPPIVMPPLPTRRNRLRQIMCLAQLLGFPTLMPHQALIIAGMTELAEGEDQQLRWPEACITIPRQEGKTVLSAIAAIDRLIMRNQAQNVLWTSQKIARAVSFWEKHPAEWMRRSSLQSFMGWSLNRSVSDPKVTVNATRSHMPIISSQSHIDAHGETSDAIIIDEAHSIVDDRVDQAQRPTLTTRFPFGAQMLSISTAGDTSSVFLKQRTDDGRAAQKNNNWKSLAVWEWGAGDDVTIDHLDPEVWRKAMPALGYTVTEDIIASQAERMAENEFRRAYLNQWINITEATVVTLQAWRRVESAKGVRVPL